MKNIFWTREKKGDIIYPIMEQCFRCSGSIKMTLKTMAKMEKLNM